MVKLPDLGLQHTKTPVYVLREELNPETGDKAYLRKLFTDGDRALCWHEVKDRLIDYVQNHTLDELKQLYTKITGDPYEGVRSKKAVALGIIRHWFPAVPDGTVTEILAWFSEAVKGKGEWGLGCDCGRFIAFAIVDGEWRPADPEAYRLQRAEVLETVGAWTQPEWIDKESVFHPAVKRPAQYLVLWDDETKWVTEIPERRGYLNFIKAAEGWQYTCDSCGKEVILES